MRRKPRTEEFITGNQPVSPEIAAQTSHTLRHDDSVQSNWRGHTKTAHVRWAASKGWALDRVRRLLNALGLEMVKNVLLQHHRFGRTVYNGGNCIKPIPSLSSQDTDYLNRLVPV